MRWAYEVDDGTPSRPVWYHYPQYATRAEAEAERERMYGTGGYIRRVQARERVLVTYHDGDVEMTLCPKCAWLRDVDYDDDMSVVCVEHDAWCDDCDEDEEGGAR
jgi:archaeosine-15-forming tRNA-guanine transglycosylase